MTPPWYLSLQVLGKNVSYFLIPLRYHYLVTLDTDTWLLLPSHFSGDVSPKLSTQEMLSILSPAPALPVRWVLVLVDKDNIILMILDVIFLSLITSLHSNVYIGRPAQH